MTCKSIRSSGLKDQTNCDQCQVRFVIRCVNQCFLFLKFYKIRSFIASVQDVSKFFVMFLTFKPDLFTLSNILCQLWFFSVLISVIFFFFNKQVVGCSGVSPV